MTNPTARSPKREAFLKEAATLPAGTLFARYFPESPQRKGKVYGENRAVCRLGIYNALKARLRRLKGSVVESGVGNYMVNYLINGYSGRSNFYIEEGEANMLPMQMLNFIGVFIVLTSSSFKTSTRYLWALAVVFVSGLMFRKYYFLWRYSASSTVWCSSC